MSVLSEESFTFVDNRTGKSVVLPIVKGSQGPEAVDVRTFFSKTGLFLFDPGYASIASCESSITYIDGVEGLMQYRGYPIEQLAKHSTFLETAYLLLHGELPNEQQYSSFVKQVKGHVMVQDRIRHFIEGFRPDAHPMAVMVGVVGALSSFYHDSLDVHDPGHRLLASIRLIAKMPTIAAWAYKYTIGHPFIYPRRELGFAENLLYMMFATPCDDYKVNPVVARALDKILILHADHEQNMSTCTVRIAGSSHSNPFACIASGIAALWGPDHGGANEAALKMLITIGHKDRIPEFLAKAKDKKDPFRLMGFGHRVYKNFDPRALIIKQACHEVLSELGLKEQPIFALALELEKIALEDQYFIERSLYPNVDFYSGILLHAMGIPVNMFTVVFAIARVVGWVAQWKEMIESPNWRLSRPRQVYMGEPKRPYVPIAQRAHLKENNAAYPPSPLLSQAKPPSLWQIFITR